MAETQDDHKLVVSLEARIRAYEKAIEKAHRETSRRMQGIEDALKGPRTEMGRFERAGATMATGFSRHVATASTALTGFAKGVIAGGALAAIASFSGAIVKARTALSDFAKISDTARDVGLSPETYQALSFGATEASISQETLNGALASFVTSAGQAVVGQGKLVSKLKELNPELLKSIVAADNQEERLRLVADALNRQASATQRAALANAVFGESGIEVARVLSAGAAAIDDLKRGGKDLGLIIPDDLLERSAELDNKLDVLSKVIDTNLSTALVKLAPLLVSASEGAASFAQEIVRMSDAVDNFRRNPDLDSFLNIFQVSLVEGGLADRFRDFVNSGLEASRRTSDEIKAEIGEIEDRIAKLQSPGAGGSLFPELEIQREISLLEDLRAELKRVEIATKAAATNGANALDNLTDKTSAAVDEVSAAIAAQAAEAAKYQAVMDQVNGAASKFGDGAFTKQTAALARYIENAQRAADATDAIAQAQEHLAIVAAGALHEISAAVDTNGTAFAKVKREIGGLADELINQTMAADNVVVRLQDVEESLRDLGVGESVIARLVRAFGILAGTILNAKAALDAYNTTQVGTGTRTVDPNTGIGVTRFGGDRGDNSDVIRSLENGVGVTRHGFERSEDAIGRVNSSVGNFDEHTGGYFDGLADQVDRSSWVLGDRILSGLNAVASSFGSGNNSSTNGMSTGGIISSNGGLGIGLGMGSSGGGYSSSTGKRYTSSLSPWLSVPLWGYEKPNMDDDLDGSTSGPVQPIEVNVTVRPVFEGTRVSPQSIAEIERAAAEGANAALRAYSGR